MITRRELALGAAGFLAPSERRVSLTLGVGKTVAVRLEDVDVDVLTGVPARLLSSSAPSAPVLTIEVTRRTGRLQWNEPGVTCEVAFPDGVTGFVAAWALPVVKPGLIGLRGDDLCSLLRRGRARYWPSTPWAELSTATACHACYLGAWVLATISRHAEQVARHLAPSADFIFADSLSPLDRAARLTVFD